MSRNKFLLGATKEHEIVFGEFEVTERNGYREFTASFDCVRPFKGRDIDLTDYFSEFADRKAMGDKYVLDLLEEYDCSPSQLSKIMASNCDDPRDAMDCSLYPEEYIINGEEWYFESSSCGQCDVRKKMSEYTDFVSFSMLIMLWDLYHLQKIPSEMEDRLEYIISRMSIIDEEEWITHYIEKCVEKGEL